jgi:methionyl-tRNA formyltransferase
MQMERGLDTGPMIAKVEVEIGRKTAGELTRELAGRGAELMRETLRDTRKMVREAQPEAGVTYASKVEKAEARIEWSRPAAEIERQVRAFNPAPGAHAYYAGERIIMHFCEISDAQGEPGTVLDDKLTIACGDGAIVPALLQRPGGRAMSPDELLRGFRIPVGSKFE